MGTSDTESSPPAGVYALLVGKTGTVSGSDGKLDPTGGSTRAQKVQVLYNLLGK